jgi:polyphosphate glucokinase
MTKKARARREGKMTVLGIDIGGSGIKGAPVDLSAGTLARERHRIETPQPSVPDRVAKTVAEVAAEFDTDGPVGVTFPGVVTHGTVRTAANVDPAWIGVNAESLFSEVIGRPVTVLNDADAAGVAEVAFGAARGEPGVVMLLTFGTGIGSALLLDGELVPNTELGHLELRGGDAEDWASDNARETGGLGWPEWAGRVQEYLTMVENLFWPDLIIVGGGVSKKAERFLPHVDVRTRVVPATLLNNAGIVGAAMTAKKHH